MVWTTLFCKLADTWVPLNSFPMNLLSPSPIPSCLLTDKQKETRNKKVLLRECKRHTADLVGGYLPQAGWGTPLSRPGKGVPPSTPSAGWVPLPLSRPGKVGTPPHPSRPGKVGTPHPSRPGKVGTPPTWEGRYPLEGRYPPHPSRPPLLEVWTDRQTENITFPILRAGMRAAKNVQLMLLPSIEFRKWDSCTTHYIPSWFPFSNPHHGSFQLRFSPSRLHQIVRFLSVYSSEVKDIPMNVIMHCICGNLMSVNFYSHSLGPRLDKHNTRQRVHTCPARFPLGSVYLF